MTDKKYNGWNDSDTRSSGVPKNEEMTKEQIEQAAKDIIKMTKVGYFEEQVDAIS